SDAPTITTVETGIWASQKNTTPEVVDVQNFELTTTPVPEPATLGLFAASGGLGLLLLKRRHRVAVG
ncbi:MAG: PEP-CTERM sorting domain-containing protein, partial [Phycisphaerae bacterium]